MTKFKILRKKDKVKIKKVLAIMLGILTMFFYFWFLIQINGHKK